MPDSDKLRIVRRPKVFSVVNNGAETSIDLLRRRCDELGLSFALTWSQAEGLWYAESHSDHEFMFAEVERVANEYMAASRLLEKINEKWPPG